jgi:hypothetical protein
MLLKSYACAKSKGHAALNCTTCLAKLPTFLLLFSNGESLSELRQVPVQSLGDLILGHCAYNLFHHLAVLENQNRGNSTNVVPPR